MVFMPTLSMKIGGGMKFKVTYIISAVGHFSFCHLCTHKLVFEK